MSVNKLLTFINHNCKRRKEENSLLDESDKSIIFIKLTLVPNQILLKQPPSYKKSTGQRKK